MALILPLRRVGSAWTFFTLRVVADDLLITTGLTAGREMEIAVGLKSDSPREFINAAFSLEQVRLEQQGP